MYDSALIKAIRNENVNVIGHLAPDYWYIINLTEIKIPWGRKKSFQIIK